MKFTTAVRASMQHKGKGSSHAKEKDDFSSWEHPTSSDFLPMENTENENKPLTSDNKDNKDDKEMEDNNNKNCTNNTPKGGFWNGLARHVVQRNGNTCDDTAKSNIMKKSENTNEEQQQQTPKVGLSLQWTSLLTTTALNVKTQLKSVTTGRRSSGNTEVSDDFNSMLERSECASAPMTLSAGADAQDNVEKAMKKKKPKNPNHVRFDTENVRYYPDEVRSSLEDCKDTWFNEKRDYSSFRYQAQSHAKLGASPTGATFRRALFQLYEQLEAYPVDDCNLGQVVDDILNNKKNKRLKQQLRQLYIDRLDWVGLEMDICDAVQNAKTELRSSYEAAVVAPSGGKNPSPDNENAVEETPTTISKDDHDEKDDDKKDDDDEDNKEKFRRMWYLKCTRKSQLWAIAMAVVRYPM